MYIQLQDSLDKSSTSFYNILKLQLICFDVEIYTMNWFGKAVFKMKHIGFGGFIHRKPTLGRVFWFCEL